ncbi:hypothetical protein PULV_b0248 [Pseudoalteromonas ulvae UL12]|uniref:VOC family virulence protein n=1 Tax=Pseudoalteromonas ulvae TaxID=107327 RepID=A0A244CM00_PSEDV|nr:VOC family protein [Pseudoalteromonas ulvae]MBE0365632.1 hypothetical protein [Pseudoalteromonas ulvae UL12]OUL56624.1 VOC family virulence protein [Pseudoalteromonas ulvae]
MLRLMGLDHIVLRTNKLTEMLHFYCDVLGCEIERALPSNVGLTQLRAGSALIDLVDVESQLGRQGGKAPTSQGNNLDHFCLQVAPMPQREIKAYLEAKGIAVGDFASRYGAQGFGQSVYITDPQGNTVELRCQQVFNPNQQTPTEGNE